MPNPSPSSKLRELREAATPGEWKVLRHETQRYGTEGYAYVLAVEIPGFHEANVIKVCHEDWPPTPADSDLIVYLVNHAEAIEGLIAAAGAFAEQISRSVVMVHNPGGSCSYCDLNAALNALREEA